MISFILLLLLTSLKASFGDTCEERLNKIEGLLEKLEHRYKSDQLAENDIEAIIKSLVEASLKNKRQELEKRWLRMEKVMQKKMKNIEMSLETRMKTFEDKMYSKIQKAEENLQKRVMSIEEKLKDYNNQKVKINILEARIAELRMVNQKQQSFYEGLERKNKSFEDELNTLLNAKVRTKVMKNMKTKQMAPSNILPTSHIKVLESTGNETQNTFEERHRKSEQKRLLTGIHPTSSPFPDVVAFSSYISTYETHLTEDHTIKFDKIVTNVGNHYNPHSGLFTAPRHGVYVFSWTLYCYTDGYIFSQLVVNSNVIGAMLTTAQGAGNFRATTWIVVVEVNKDDVVYIRTHPTQSHSGSLYSAPDWRSSFSGWILN